MSQDPRDAAREVWGASPAGWTFGDGADPGTREFFERVLERRSTYEQPWLFDLVPFSSYAGRRVLEIGCGAGYDAYEFCRQGAEYTGIDLTPENVDRTRAHLSLYGFHPDVREADAENLPFENDTFDVVFSNGVLHHVPDIGIALAEAFRVLKSGGVIWLIVYHRDSVFHWVTLFGWIHLLRGGFRRHSFRERLSMIEASSSSSHPIVNVYSRRAVVRMLADAGFVNRAIAVRKLVAEDLPAPGFLWGVWKRVPLAWLDRIGRRWGWYVVASANKTDA
jgi:SAM-dependent methyltransferase